MLAYLTRVLKIPTIGRCWEELAAQARDENWSHEEYLAAVLQRQVAERESAGTMMRIRTAHFPAVKTIEDFNLDHLPSLRRDVLAHLATGTFVAKAENVILLGPPGLGKTHLAIGLGVKAAHAGYSVLFDTANNWIIRLAEAHQAGRLEAELKKIRRYKLIIIDEVGYIPFDQDAANLFFQLIASRYEVGSVMVTSNLPFGKAHMFARTCARRRQNLTGSPACGRRRRGRRGRSARLGGPCRTRRRRVSDPWC
jgi:DNA replication protein DnaC